LHPSRRMLRTGGARGWQISEPRPLLAPAAASLARRSTDALVAATWVASTAGGGHLGAADGDAHDPQEQLERKVHRGFFARGSGPAVLNPGGSANEGRRDGAGLRCRVGNAGHRSVELPIGRACLLHSYGYPSGQLPGFGVRPPRGRSRSSRCPRRPCSARPRDGDGRAACRRRCR